MNRLVAPSSEISRTESLAGVAGLRQPHETLEPVRHADERIHRLAVLGAGKLQGHREAEIGNERERMRRIDGERRQQRKNMGEEIIFEPRLLRLGHIGAVDQHDAGSGQRRAQFAPLRLLVLSQHHDGFGDTGQLLGRRQPFGALLGDAGADLGAKAGHAHHEEFVEVVGRDRQELEPLEQRMAAIGGFLQHAAIEVQPRQLAVDEPVRTRGKIGSDMRDRFRRPAGARFHSDDSGLTTVGHNRTLLLKRYCRHPSLQFDDNRSPENKAARWRLVKPYGGKALRQVKVRSA